MVSLMLEMKFHLIKYCLDEFTNSLFVASNVKVSLKSFREGFILSESLA